VLGAAVWLKFGSDRKTIEGARIFLGGIASAPLRCVEAEAALEGRALTPEIIAQAAEAAYVPAKPMDNTDFDRYWRKQMVRVWVKRAIEEAGR